MKKVILSEDTRFRGQDLLKDEVCELPTGVAHKLIAKGKASSVYSDTPIGIPVSIEYLANTEDLNDLKVPELKAVCEYLELDTAGAKVKADYIDIIEEHRDEE